MRAVLLGLLAVLIVGGLTLLPYLVLAFAYLDPNPLNWSPFSRGFFLFAQVLWAIWFLSEVFED